MLATKDVHLGPPPCIELLAVWDTVLALGNVGKARGDLVREREMCIGRRPAAIARNVRHALAIDEERADFLPEIWEEPAHADQTLQQCWFVGAHTDVGGSYGRDGLANIALHWVTTEARFRGLAIDDSFLSNYRPFSRDVRHDSSDGGFRILDRFRSKDGCRDIPLAFPDPNFRLSPSVVERMWNENPRDADSGCRYRPAPLINYLAEQPDTDAALADPGLAPNSRRLPPGC